MYRANYFFILNKTTDFYPHLISAWDVVTDKDYSYSRTDFDQSFYPKDTIVLVRMLKGTMIIHCKSNDYVLNEGELLLLPIREIIKYNADSNVINYFWFNFTVNEIPYFEIGMKYKTPIFSEEYDKLQEMARLENDSDIMNRNLVNAIFTELMYRYILTVKKKDMNSNTVINDIVENIQNDYNKELTIRDIAKKHGLTEKKLRAMFYKYIGMSPKKYQIKIRMQKATNLLQTTEMNINEISDILGYDSQFQFSRDFKNFYNISPTKYRNDK